MDYVSRRARGISTLPIEQQNECNEFNNLLYTLLTTQVMDHISLARIAKETAIDDTLSIIQDIIRKSKKISPNAPDEAKRF